MCIRSEQFSASANTVAHSDTQIKSYWGNSPAGSVLKALHREAALSLPCFGLLNTILTARHQPISCNSFSFQ